MILCYFVKMKKNILFINHSVRDGGPGRSLFYLLKHFDYNKYNVHVLIPSKNAFSENIKNENLNINEIISKNFPENLKKQNFNILGKSISTSLFKKIITSKLQDIYVALDNDAKDRAYEIAEKYLNQGKRVFLVNLPDKDPSEMGFKAFTEHIQTAEELAISGNMLHKLDL